MRILIGDGRSDFCAADTADLVIAKGALAEHCQTSGIGFTVFGNFAGATTVLRTCLPPLSAIPLRPTQADLNVDPPLSFATLVEPSSAQASWMTPSF